MNATEGVEMTTTEDVIVKACKVLRLSLSTASLASQRFETLCKRHTNQQSYIKPPGDTFSGYHSQSDPYIWHNRNLTCELIHTIRQMAQELGRFIKVTEQDVKYAINYSYFMQLDSNRC